MKTIDIQAKEWFDKANGNSYFSALVTIDLGLETEKKVYIPFQYGYDSAFEYESMHQLQTAGLLPNSDTIYSPSRYCSENGIQLRTSKQEGCRKAEVKAWGSN